MPKKTRFKPAATDPDPIREMLPVPDPAFDLPLTEAEIAALRQEPVTQAEKRQIVDDYSSLISGDGQGDTRDRLPAMTHPAVQAAQASVDYPALAQRCLRASNGHGASRDRELLMEAAVALAELGGFDLE